MNNFLKTINLKDYIKLGKYRISGNYCILYNCPICQGHDHFWVNKNKYGSHSKCCTGGSLWDWYIEYEKLSKSDARQKIVNLMGGISVQEKYLGPQNYDKFENVMHEEVKQMISKLEKYCKIMIKNGYVNSKYERMLMYLEKQKTLLKKYYFVMQLKDNFYL